MKLKLNKDKTPIDPRTYNEWYFLNTTQQVRLLYEYKGKMGTLKY